MKIRSVVLACVSATLLLGIAAVPSAGAAGTVTVTPNPVPFAPGQTSQPVTVNWTGQAANKVIYIDICNKLSSDPTFQPGQDCAPLSSQTANGNATGAGTISVDIFRGAEPSGDLTWGCFAAGDTAPAGITKSTTCYVRVTNDSLFNTNAAVDAPFTIPESGGVIPEAPMTILLPTIGGLVAVAGFFFLRRRQAVGA